MRRWVNPEIALGFALGFLTLLFFIGILSYQAEHCSEVNSHAETKPAQDKLRPNPENAEDRNGEESSYNDSHPIACGAIGLPSAIIGYMDKNEGFFVGLFTFGLFLATIFLWITTNNLWRAGEKQIEVWKETAETAKRSADAFIQVNAIGRAQVRAFVSVTESPASEILESDGG